MLRHSRFFFFSFSKHLCAKFASKSECSSYGILEESRRMANFRGPRRLSLLDGGGKKQSGEIIMISYSQAKNEFGLTVENKEIQSLNNGEVVRLDIVFTKNGEFFRHIKNVDFVFSNTAKRTLTARRLDTKFGDFVGYSDNMGLFRTNQNGQSVIVSAVNLKGSSQSDFETPRMRFQAIRPQLQRPLPPIITRPSTVYTPPSLPPPRCKNRLPRVCLRNIPFRAGNRSTPRDSCGCP